MAAFFLCRPVGALGLSAIDAFTAFFDAIFADRFGVGRSPVPGEQRLVIRAACY